MIATLFHAASTTTSSHDHIQSPTPPARPITRLATGERGEGAGGEGGGGMITTLSQAASTTTTSSHPRGQHDQSPASQRVRRRGKGGHCGQHHHIESPVTHTASTTGGSGGDDEATASPPAIYTASTTSHPHPVTRAATCEREGGEGAGPQRAYKRLCWRLFPSLLEVVPRAGDGGGGRGGWASTGICP